MLTKTQTDRLGDRLRQGDYGEADLRLLDDYRRSFSEAYDFVIGSIRTTLGLEPTGRPAKTTTSIAEKLRREHIRLTQIQDIAGCRLVVQGLIDQDRTLAALSKLFPESTIIDRRQRPSHGYRAVHVVVRTLGRVVEIQLRTELQQKWAELSEKLSDLIEPSIKYGGGDDKTKEFLATASQVVISAEELESVLNKLESRLSELQRNGSTDEELKKVTDEGFRLRTQAIEAQQETLEIFRASLAGLEELELEDDPL